MPRAAGKAATVKKTAAADKPKTTRAKSKSSKISITLEKDVMEDLEVYLEGIGVSKEAFALRAVEEKLSRDKISYMIDTMIR